jgi:hypothetical protein
MYSIYEISILYFIYYIYYVYTSSSDNMQHINGDGLRLTILSQSQTAKP